MDVRRITICCLLLFLQFVSSISQTVDITKPNVKRKEVNRGQPFTIECTVVVNEDQFVSLGWRFMADDSLSPDNIYNNGSYDITEVSKSKNRHISALTIHNITYWQEGYYYCHLVTTHGQDTDFIEVRVQGPPHIDAALSTNPTTINAILGETLEIACYIKARPEAQVTWFRNGKEVSSFPYTISTNAPLLTIDSESTLSVYPLSVSQLGVYMCRANNTRGQAVMKWDVQAIPSLSVTRPTTNTTQISYGYQLNIECEGINFLSNRVIKWYSGTGTSQEDLNRPNDRISIYTFRSVSGILSSELTINGADFEDQGWYTCISQDLFSTVRISVVSRPVVTTSTSTVTTLPGASVTLTCHIRARPTLTAIGWYKGSTVLGNSSKYEVVSTIGDPDSYTTLTILSVAVSDYGNKYKCGAINELGRGETAIKIQDVNECESKKKPCDTSQYEECVDTLGSYECRCVAGYARVQGVCADINECEDEKNSCSQICENLSGSFRCKCQDGHQLQSDMVTCVAVDTDPTISLSVAKPNPKNTPTPTPSAFVGDDTVAIGVGVGIGVLVFIIIVVVIVICCRRRANTGRELLDVPKTKPPAPPRGFYNTAYSVEGEEAHIYTELSATGDEFPRGRLRFLNSLGEGKFGRVVMAEALSISRTGKWEEVAVKMVKETATDAIKEDFYHELLIVRKIPAHRNVVAYLGCVTSSEPALIIMEYVNGGDLLTYLRKRRPENADSQNTRQDPLTPKDLLSFALQTARGLAHIAAHKIIHRDVAARNVLINRKHECKISDFGLARDVEGADIYERTNRGPLPIRWMAPESLRDSIHTTKSDVWGYGVLLWEIVTLGASPYPGLSGQMVMAAVLEGKRLLCPPQCNQEMYTMMSRCWEASPDSRPSFSDLARSCENMLEQEGDYIQLDHIQEGIYQVLEGLRSEERL